jgi:hypothetical protein
MSRLVIPVEETVNNAFDSIRPFIEPVTDVISEGLEAMLDGAEDFKTW